MKTVRIVPDNYPSNPRDNDNLCLMACVHGRYELGDKDAKSIIAKKLEVNSSEYSLSELVDMAEKSRLIFAMKPLYMYDHSGQTVSTSPFSCQWDSGQIGVVILFKETIKQEFGVKRFGKNIIAQFNEKADSIIEAEVKEYDAYISGDYYSLEMLDADGEVEDSVSGFIGTDVSKNGMLDYIPAEMHEYAKTLDPVYA